MRLLHDGCFDFAGRADDQVKLRGQRLEIGEINATIKRAHPKVKAVSTLVLKHPKQQTDQLVSFIAFEGADREKGVSRIVETREYSPLVGIIIDTCKQHLSVYMVPTHFLPVTTIPLSVNNKVDNKKLAQLYQATSLEQLQALSYRNTNESDQFSSIELRLRDILADMMQLSSADIKRSSSI